MSSMNWFAIFAGANGLIIVALACLVSYRRIHLKVPHGDGGLVAMKQAIRAHGNAIEHVPLMGLIVLALCLLQADSTLILVIMTSFTLARVLHPIGMLSRWFNARRIGAGLSYLSETAGCVAAIAVALP